MKIDREIEKEREWCVGFMLFRGCSWDESLCARTEDWTDLFTSCTKEGRTRAFISICPNVGSKGKWKSES